MSIKPVAWMSRDPDREESAFGYYRPVQIFHDDIPLYAIPDTHRVVSVDDLKLLLSFAPGEIPKGLDPTFYFTLTQDGDARIGGQLARIRAIIEDKP